MPSNRFWDGMVRSHSLFGGGGGSVVEATVYSRLSHNASDVPAQAQGCKPAQAGHEKPSRAEAVNMA